MGQIKNITLNIESNTVAGKRKVTVGFKLAFSSADAGKKYKYRIGLRGDDTNEPVTSPIGIYYFTFSNNNSYSPLVTAVQGDHSFSESRQISIQTLNEDPGFHYVEVDHNTKIKFSDQDEIFAEISLYTVANAGTAQEMMGLVDKELSPIVTIRV